MRSVVLIILALAAAVGLAAAATMEIPIPAHAKEVQCVGGAVRKICVGQKEETLLGLFGTPVAWWRAQDSSKIYVYEFNRGKSGCWFRFVDPRILRLERESKSAKLSPRALSDSPIKSIQCVGLEE